MSNFDFLKDYDEELWLLGNRIEANVTVSPPAVKADATPFLQKVLKILLSEIGVQYNPRKDFYYQLDAVYRKGIIARGYKDKIYGAYRLRNKVHDNLEETVRSEYFTAQQLHKNLFYIAKKLYRDFSDNYDNFKGVPAFRPIEIDTSDDEVELIKIPDFSEIIDIKYDYCVICGEPNHSNYSLCCPKCNRILDNANNFISIRNSFGKNAKFTKEDLIEYGIPEGYVNQLVSSMVREDMLKVKGRYYSFNNMHLDEYLTKIDNYLSVCELITLLREDKITPAEIKQTPEYKHGSFHQDPFYQFYKIIDKEIIIKFENDILTTENIQSSIEYTTITQKQLQRWYMIELGQYQKGNVNESFVVFNSLLKRDYIDLKQSGISEKDIKSRLNVSPEIYEFWSKTDKEFLDKIEQIKRDLLIRAISDGKTKEEIIEIAGVTQKEYDDLIKLSDFKDDELSKVRNRELNSRRENFVKHLEHNDLKNSCTLAKIGIKDFYGWYDKEDLTSSFYVNSTRLLMSKYLEARRTGLTQSEAASSIGIEEKYVNRWLARKSEPLYDDFNDANLKVTVDLILEGFKNNKTKEEIASEVDVTVQKINVYLDLGKRGSSIYKELYEYYEKQAVPVMLSKFLKANENKSIRKAIEVSGLTENELDHYYEMGKNGNEDFNEFYDEYLDIKKGTYVIHAQKGKSHNICIRESRLTEEEYLENKQSIEELLTLIKIRIILEEIKNDKTSSVAASKANMAVDEIYEWYFKGKDDEDGEFGKFYDAFHKGYVKPAIESIQNALDNKNWKLNNIIRSNKDKFTKKDVEIWVKNGLLDNKRISLDNSEEKDEDDNTSISKSDADKMINEMGVKGLENIAKTKSNYSSSTILNTSKDDVEKLKKQLLKK